MGSVRPCVGVYDLSGSLCGSLPLPGVFAAPVRPDLVAAACRSSSSSSRQPYAVAPRAGYCSSARSWGTGRAVSRVPRVKGGGSHRCGQGAFGNMCRGGGMFAPTKVWRRWQRSSSSSSRRHAVAAALAAAALPALVEARGHAVAAVKELPLVVEARAEALRKTREALLLLQRLGLQQELLRVRCSSKLRAGRGKTRGRRFLASKGPLVVCAGDNGDTAVSRAFRNIPGVDCCSVARLSVLLLAPGGVVGRLCVFTAAALQQLQQLFGDPSGLAAAPRKRRYHLLRPLLQNPDVARVVNSDEVQAVLRPQQQQQQQQQQQRRRRQHKNLLSNAAVLRRVNPAAANLKRNARLQQQPGSRPHEILQRKKQQVRQQRRTHRKAAKIFMHQIRSAFSDTARANIAAAKQQQQQQQQQQA